jgi:hypothetical protein
MVVSASIVICLILLIFIFIAVRTMDDDGILTIIYFCVVFGIISLIGIFYLPYKINEYGCEKKAVAQGLEYKFGLFEGCLVKEPSEKNFIDYDRYRIMK